MTEEKEILVIDVPFKKETRRCGRYEIPYDKDNNVSIQLYIEKAECTGGYDGDFAKIMRVTIEPLFTEDLDSEIDE